MKKTKKEVVEDLKKELKKEAEETGGVKLDLNEIEGRLTEVEETGTPKPKEEKSVWYWIFERV